LKINENSFKSKELLNQHNNEKEELISLNLRLLKIRNASLKNENIICFLRKEKKRIEKLTLIKLTILFNNYIIPTESKLRGSSVPSSCCFSNSFDLNEFSLNFIYPSINLLLAIAI
jgi:hypothetical protein